MLVTSEEIQDKVRELGERITEDYQGEDLLLVGILRKDHQRDRDAADRRAERRVEVFVDLLLQVLTFL